MLLYSQAYSTSSEWVQTVMPYQALYRTYRPRQFSEVVGQQHVLRTLINSVKQGKVGHAYLFSGPRGTGKTTVARLLARVINCLGPVDGEPCSECDRCRGSEEGLGVLEIDAASHGSVDDMRQLVAQVSQVPMSGGRMVYIIDEVHMLSKEAFNAFLKTLEEPPPHAVFVLATTEPGKLLPTIHSRCQHFAFRRLPIDIVAGHIASICEMENISAEDAAIRLIARAGDGSVRDSISVLEQTIAYEPGGLTLQGVRDVLGIPDRMDVRTLGGYIISCDPGRITESYTKLIESGREPKEILTELMIHFRDLLFAALELDHTELAELPGEERDLIISQAGGQNVDRLHKAIAFLAKCEGDIRWEDEAALILEVSLLRLSTRFKAPPVSEAQGRVESKPSAEKPAEETFPAAKSTKPVTIPPEKPAEPETRSLTGGKSLKRRRTASESAPVTPKSAPQEPPKAPEIKTTEPTADKPETPADKPEPTEAEIIKLPAEIDPAWKNTLETIREISIAEYVLLARAHPEPLPGDWPESTVDSPLALQLTLKYAFEDGLLVKLINSPTLLNRLVTRLESVLERPMELKVAQERRKPGNGQPGETRQSSMVDGEGQVVGNNGRDGPSLFPGAGREPPTDPDLRKIHNLIVEDFPDYKVDPGQNP